MAVDLTELMTMLQQNKDTQATVSTRQDEVLAQVMEVTGQQEALSREATVALDTYKQATAEAGSAAVTAQNMEAAVGLADLPAVLEAEQAIRDVSKQTVEYNATINQAFQTQMDEFLQTLQIVEEGANVGALDILNPMTIIPSLKKRFAADKASAVADVQFTQLQALDMAQRTNTAQWQSSVSAMRELATMRQLENSQLYFQQYESAATARRMATAKEIASTDLDIIKERFGFSEAAMGSLRTQLETLRSQGDLSQRQLSSAISAIQVQQSQEQLDVWKRTAERDEAARSRLNDKLVEASNMFGLDISSFEEYEQLLASRSLDPATQYVVSMYVSRGYMGAETIWNSASPSTALSSIGSSPGQTVITPEVMALAGAVRDRVMTDGTSISPTATAEEQQAAVDAALNKTYQDAFTDIDSLYQAGRGLFSIPNPSKMDYSPAGGMSVPMAAVPVLQKLNIQATDFTSFAQGAIRAVLADENSMANLEAVTRGLSEISRLTLRGVNSATGFGIPQAKTMGLAVDGARGDATNPADWYRAIQVEAARQRSRSARSTEMTPFVRGGVGP